MSNSAYDAQIFKALGKFKQIRNWPDLNTCLQTLLDVFHSFPDVTYVSHKLLLAKTLSQCLSPSLPAGIQGKTLDVYLKIFERAGEARISRDFYIWSPGLFQFFHSAGIAQRIVLIKLFKDFFIPLIPTNQRIAPPVILAILPGLMDEGTEVQSSIKAILAEIEHYSGKKYFWRALYRFALTYQGVRQPFFYYVLRADSSSVLGLESPKLLEAAMLDMLRDPDILNLRGALDLLLMISPHLDEQTKFLFGKSAVKLLEIDDQSIRRRIFAWMQSSHDILHRIIKAASPVCVQVIYDRGEPFQTMVNNCLPDLIARKDIAIPSLLKLLDPVVVIKAGGTEFEALLRIIPFVQMNSQAKSILIETVIREMPRGRDIDILCSLAEIAFDMVESIPDELVLSSVKHILMQENPSDASVTFAFKLLKKKRLDFDFCEVKPHKNSICYLLNLLDATKSSIHSVFALDTNSRAYISSILADLVNMHSARAVGDVVSLLLRFYDMYPSSFTIEIKKHWEPELIEKIAVHTKRIPLPLLEIALDMPRNTGTLSVLRVLASKSGKIFDDFLIRLAHKNEKFFCSIFEQLKELLSIFSKNFMDGFYQSLNLVFSNCLGLKGSAGFLRGLLLRKKPLIGLNDVAQLVIQYALNNPEDIETFQLLDLLTDYQLPLIEIGAKVQSAPYLLPFVTNLFAIAPATSELQTAIENLFTRTLNMVKTNRFCLISDIVSMFKMLILRINEEVAKIRAVPRTTGFKRIIQSTEELSPDGCIASLTLASASESSALYSSLLVRFLPLTISKLSSSSELLTEFLKSLPSGWYPAALYSMAFGQGLQDAALMNSYFSILSGDLVLPHLDMILSLAPEGIDSFTFMTAVIQTGHGSISSVEGAAFMCKAIQKLNIGPNKAIKILLLYSVTYPSDHLHILSSSLASALSEVRNNPEEVVQALESLLEVDTEVISSIFNTKVLPNAVAKTYLALDHTHILNARIIKKYCAIPYESFTWAGQLIEILSDKSLFTYERQYLEAVRSAIYGVAASDEKFPALIFDMLTTFNTPAYWKSNKEYAASKSLHLLSFIIFSCDGSTFANSQQQINIQLIRSLSSEGLSGKQFVGFSQLMRSIFLRLPSRLIEGMMPMLMHELIIAFESEDVLLKTEAEKLLRFAIEISPVPIQFCEFAFIPDCLTFREEDPKESKWPLLKDSQLSTEHLFIDSGRREKAEISFFDELISFNLKIVP